MMITDVKTAREFLAAWGGNPRPGIRGAVVDGLRKAARISRGQGNKNMAADYDAAADTIERGK